GKETAPVAPEVRSLAHLGAWTAGAALLMASSSLVPEPPPDMPRAPARLTDFIAEKRLPGRMFNDYDNSGYLEWRLGERFPLFIDMLNAYPEGVVLDYGCVVTGGEDGRRLLEHLDVGYVVLSRPNSEGRALAPFARDLSRDPRWVIAYSGRDG